MKYCHADMEWPRTQNMQKAQLPAEDLHACTTETTRQYEKGSLGRRRNELTRERDGKERVMEHEYDPNIFYTYVKFF